MTREYIPVRPAMLSPALSPLEHNVSPAYRPDIDGLRAVAILSVVVFHGFPDLLRGGFAGVDVFFVISGFLISSILFRSLRRGDFSFIEFYAHRVRRIFPALVLVLAASYGIGWFALLPGEFAQLGKHMAAGAGFVQNLVLWQEAGYFDTASEYKPLMHLWSLAIEEQFYMLYPLLVWGAWRLRVNVLYVVAGLGALSFVLNVAGVGSDAVKTFFVPQTRFWELLAGGLLAYLQSFKREQLANWIRRYLFNRRVLRHISHGARRDALQNSVLSVLGLLLILVTVLVLHKGAQFPGWWALAPVSGAFLLILAGPQAWANRTILASRPMVFVGFISYPLYLWHWPLLSFARIVESGMVSREIRGAALVLSFLLAWLTFRLIEKPIRFGPRRGHKTAALCVLLTLVGAAGFHAFVNDGLPFRLQRIQGRLEQFQRNTEQFGWAEEFNREKSCIDDVNALFRGHFVEPYCRGKPGEASILLSGDSHSNALYAGLAEAFPGQVLNLAGGGCLPFFGVDSGEKNQPPQCPHGDAEAFLKIAETEARFRTIVLVARGPFYVEGGGFGEAEADIVRYIKRPDSVDSGGYGAIYEEAMRATLKRLQATGKTVFFVLDVPELGFSPKSCVNNRPLRFTDRVRNPCAVPRQVFEARNREYRRIALSVLKDFPGIRVFDAAATLCDAEWCRAMKDGRMLYRDDDHLSLEGSRYVAAELAVQIRAAGK